LILLAFIETENQFKKFFFLTDARRSILNSAHDLISFLKEWLQMVSDVQQQASERRFVALKRRVLKRISSRFGMSTSDLIPQAPQKLTKNNNQVTLFYCNYSASRFM
jgi:hypothetical protein